MPDEDREIEALRRRLALSEAENRVLRSGNRRLSAAAAPIVALASRIEDAGGAWVGVETRRIRDLARAALAVRAADLLVAAGR